MKVLHIRKIVIDVIPNGVPYIELKIDLHIMENSEVIQIISDYGRIYKRITDLNPIPIGTIADDGIVDNNELMALVAEAALTWAMIDYGGTFNEQGLLVIE